MCLGAVREEVASYSPAAGPPPAALGASCGGGSTGPQVVEVVGSGPSAEVVEVGSTGAAGGGYSGSPQSASCSSSSTNMLSPSSLTPTTSKTEEGVIVLGMVSSKVTSHVSTIRLVSRFKTL